MNKLSRNQKKLLGWQKQLNHLRSLVWDMQNLIGELEAQRHFTELDTNLKKAAQTCENLAHALQKYL